VQVASYASQTNEDFTKESITITGNIYNFQMANYIGPINNLAHPEQDKIDSINAKWAQDLQCPSTLDINTINKHALLYSNDTTESLYKLKASDVDYSLCYGTIAGKLIAKYEKKELARDPNYVKTEEQNAKLLNENKRLNRRLVDTHTPTLRSSNDTQVVQNLLTVKQQLSNNVNWQKIIKELQILVSRGHLLTNVIQSLNPLTKVDIETNSQQYQTFVQMAQRYINLQKMTQGL
jgi:hypothetical protein